MAETLGAEIAHDLGTGSSARHSPTRELRLHGALGAPVERRPWSRLTNAAPEPLASAWDTRYAARHHAVDELCTRVSNGRVPLSVDTLAGEVDWAVEHEDCLTARDFLFRRTDLGLERRELVDGVVDTVIERLARVLAWDATRREREREELIEDVAARHRWREE